MIATNAAANRVDESYSGDTKITFVPCLYKPDKTKLVTLEQALDSIQTGRFKVSVEAARKFYSNRQPVSYDNAKQNLPAFAFAGKFDPKVDNASFVQSADNASFDVDKLGDALGATREAIIKLSCCLFCFVSPSGNGLKFALRLARGTIKCDADNKKVFAAAAKMLMSLGIKIKVDAACKDIRRLCFVSYDPELFVNWDAEVFDWRAWEPKQLPEPIPKAVILKPKKLRASNAFVQSTADECIGKIQNSLKKAKQGERHGKRLEAGRLAGGFVAGGLLPEEDALAALKLTSDAIAEGGVTSETEWQSILDGIEFGKSTPIEALPTETVNGDLFVNQKTEKTNKVKPKLGTGKSSFIPEKTQDTVGKGQAFTWNPLSTFNDTLDSDKKYCYVDLLREVDDNHLLKRFSIQTAAETCLPVNTVFLTGLGVYSAMASRKWVVRYQDHTRLPISLYVAAEQPSGAGKTWDLRKYQAPFTEILRTIADKVFFRLKVLTNKEKLLPQEKDEYDDLKTTAKRLQIGLFVSNATPEGLEKTLVSTNGFFSAVSSEQGLFDSLLGRSYKPETSSNNNDVVLNGFDGGYVNCQRVTREGYCGHVIGAVVCFAQTGSIEKVLSASNGTGLAERFLMLAEPHSLGVRDHTKSVARNVALLQEYAVACNFIKEIFEAPKTFKGLDVLRISMTGFSKINDHKNLIEPHLADGGKYAHLSLRGAAGKFDIQVMKVAAILHLLDGGTTIPEIADKHVRAAIDIVSQLLEANLNLCKDKGIIGVRAEFTSILSLFENDRKPRTERNIIMSKSQKIPFRDFQGNKSNLIRATLDDMVKQKVLARIVRDKLTLYEPAQ
ncbi:DUF3987 domain-containing protein [Methylobacter psychrophilus]|uniref:DUF3987 domain-containing protein n=1 Tax=Methylobacter psychrophilus TaxID=96941 RepID=UPI0021D4CE0F|nr:DUF3987 domain-containing protein [Methylobacter psychrophilus]